MHPILASRFGADGRSWLRRDQPVVSLFVPVPGIRAGVHCVCLAAKAASGRPEGP